MLISTNKSPVHMLYHDVVGRILVPFTKLSPTTIALPYVAWQRKQLISVRRISGMPSSAHERRTGCQ